MSNASKKVVLMIEMLMRVCKIIVHAKAEIEYYQKFELISYFGNFGTSEFTRKTQLGITWIDYASLSQKQPVGTWNVMNVF